MDSHEERRWRRLLLRQRGKRGLLSVIFGRGLIILLLIFLQLFIMLFFFPAPESAPGLFLCQPGLGGGGGAYAV